MTGARTLGYFGRITDQTITTELFDGLNLARQRLGNNVEILPGYSIGAPGFGHIRQKDGALEPFPHIGSVHIGNNVTVGSET